MKWVGTLLALCLRLSECVVVWFLCISKCGNINGDTSVFKSTYIHVAVTQCWPHIHRCGTFLRNLNFENPAAICKNLKCGSKNLLLACRRHRLLGTCAYISFSKKYVPNKRMCAKQWELHHNDVIIVIAVLSTCTAVRDVNPGFGHSGSSGKCDTRPSCF